MPFSDMELENFLLKIGRPRSGTRRLESPETEAARAFGSRLYGAVFATDVGRQWARSVDAAERDNLGLRLRLRLSEAPELADLPWEYLYSPTSDDFVVLSSWTPVVRYISLDKGAPPLRVAPPLRMLAMVSSPTDYPPLDVEAEWARLDEAMGGVVEAGLVEIHRLENATLRDLQRAMRRTDFHLFHFIGHGGFDEQADDGVLLLETEEGRAREVSGRQLGTILDDARTVRVAVLNACEGARSSGNDPFAGVAQSLVARGIPAVVAMQFEISDRAAIVFAHEFYTAITDGLAVEGAVGEARRAIFGSKSDVEWGTAVLYMRAEDGRLFDIGALAEATREIEAATLVLEPDDIPTVVGDAIPAAPAVIEQPPPQEEATVHAGPVVEPSPSVDQSPPVESAPPVHEPVAVGSVGGVVAPAPDETVERRELPDQPPGEEDVRRAQPPGGSGAPESPSRWVEDHVGLFSGVIVGLLAALVVAFILINSGDDGSTVTTGAGATTAGPETTISDVGPVVVEAATVGAGVAGEIVIDGDFDDWQVAGSTAYRLDSPVADTLSSNRLGEDSVGVMQLASDATALYVKVEVQDDTYSQPNEGNQIWRGDAFDMNLSLHAPGSVPERPDRLTFQLTMTPLSEVTGQPAAVLFIGNGQAFSENTVDLPVEMVGEVFPGEGWLLEARIPWQVLGLSAPPGQSEPAALFAVFDNDGELNDGRSVQAAIQAHVPLAFFQQPRTWGTFLTP